MALRKVPLLFLFCLILGCNPYDSNKANMQLIQGKWILTDLKRGAEYDSLSVDYTRQETYLIFQDSLFTQHLVDLNQTDNYMFSINNYRLGLFHNNILIQELGIDKLTKDSLILSQQLDKSIWRYKKAE